MTEDLRHALYDFPQKGIHSYGRQIDDMCGRNCKSRLRWGNNETNYCLGLISTGLDIKEVYDRLIVNRKAGHFDNGNPFV